MQVKSIVVAGTATFAIAFATSLTPASAQGFFDQLFGTQQQAAPAPSYAYDTPPAYYQDSPVAQPRARHKAVAAADQEKPKLQKPTDIMHDKTLQNGDAVMTKTGLRLYVGDDGESQHSKGDFAGVDDVDNLPKNERKALVALDTTRNDPLRGEVAPDDVSSGRSAAVATPIVAGHEIVDARGKKMRYVGP